MLLEGNTNAETSPGEHGCPLDCLCSYGERLNCELSARVNEYVRRVQKGAGAHGALFEALPKPKTAVAYGVRYAVFEHPSFGSLYVTRYGWPLRDLLLPEKWYENGLYWKEGERLGQSTGTVYRYAFRNQPPPGTSIVVKVSRFAQDVPFYAGNTFLSKVPESVMAALRFNNPFEEFGRLWRLRSSARGPRVYTKRPLAIYSPLERFPLWQLGRGQGAASMEQQAVASTQVEGMARVDLDPQRSYYPLFSWERGLDASTLHQAGALSESAMHKLTEESTRDLMAHGMFVLDHKPAHLILRRNRRGTDWVRGPAGGIAYVLVDYELLVDLPNPPSG